MFIYDSAFLRNVTPRVNLSHPGRTLGGMRDTKLTNDLEAEMTELNTPVIGQDPYIDPVGYLAENGIESELVAVVETPLPRAA